MPMPKPIGEGLEEPFSVITHTRPGVVPWRLVVRQPDETRFSINRLVHEMPDWLSRRQPNGPAPVYVDMNSGLVLQ
jgi:hypothetical protein